MAGGMQRCFPGRPPGHCRRQSVVHRTQLCQHGRPLCKGFAPTCAQCCCPGTAPLILQDDGKLQTHSVEALEGEHGHELSEALELLVWGWKGLAFFAHCMILLMVFLQSCLARCPKLFGSVPLTLAPMATCVFCVANMMASALLAAFDCLVVVVMNGWAKGWTSPTVQQLCARSLECCSLEELLSFCCWGGQPMWGSTARSSS